MSSMLAYNAANAALGPEAGYSVRFGRVIYTEYENQFMLAVSDTKDLDADPKTFVAFGDWRSGAYAKDRNFVWFHGRKIDGADAQTFEALDNALYAKDKNHVYYRHEKIDGALPAEFYLRTIPGPDGQSRRVVGVDGERLFLESNWIEGVDGPTFTWVQWPVFSADKNGIYFHTNHRESLGAKSLTVCDAESWRIVQGYQSKDNQCAYFAYFKLPNIDIETFEFLPNNSGLSRYDERGYHKDRSKVWVHEYAYRLGAVTVEEVDDADPESFIYQGDGSDPGFSATYTRGKDASGCFRGAERAECRQPADSGR